MIQVRIGGNFNCEALNLYFHSYVNVTYASRWKQINKQANIEKRIKHDLSDPVPKLKVIINVFHGRSKISNFLHSEKE